MKILNYLFVEIKIWKLSVHRNNLKIIMQVSMTLETKKHKNNNLKNLKHFFSN